MTAYLGIPTGSNVHWVWNGSNWTLQSYNAGGGGSGGGDPGAQYLTLATTASLSNERVLTPGTGLTAIDAGANSTYTININDNVIATISGSAFTGPVTASLGFSGSFVQLDGSGNTKASTGMIRLPYNNGNIDKVIVVKDSTNTDANFLTHGAGNSFGIGALTHTQTQAAFNFVLSSNTGQWDFYSYATPGYVLQITSTNVSFNLIPVKASAGFSGSLTRLSDGTPYLLSQGGITLITNSLGQIIISGAYQPNLAPYAPLAGATFTGVVSASAGLSGSLQQIGPGIPYLVGGSGVAISTSSNGQIVVQTTGFADVSASYITIATTGSLPNERALAAGAGITLGDGGAGGNATIAVTAPIQALTQSLSYSNAGAGTLSIQHSGSTVENYDAFYRMHSLKGRWLTTNSTPFTGLMFTSGANGRTYGVDVHLQCQHTSTIESGRWKLSGHMRRTAGSYIWIAQDTALSSSNVAALSGTLSMSAGNIVVSSTGNTGSFHWSAYMQIHETGV